MASRQSNSRSQSVERRIIKPREFQDWLQIIGLFGVMASLVFVGLELRQSHQIARSQATQARTETTVSSLLEIAANPYIVSGTVKLSNGESDLLTGEERAAMRLTYLALLFNYENIYLQHSEGFVSAERWAASRENLKAALRSDRDISYRAVFEARPNAWTAEFSDEVSELLLEIDSESQ